MPTLRGFALLKRVNPNLLREYCVRGGLAATNRYRWTPEQAREAARTARANEKARKNQEAETS